MVVSTASNMALIRPICVRAPVMTTSPVAWPEATSVPGKAMLLVRNSGGGSTTSSCFSTAKDSPASGASSISRPHAFSRRRSAGTLSPASSVTISPGTCSTTATLRRAIPGYIGMGRDHVADRAECALSPALLNEADDRVNQYHCADHQRINDMAEQRSRERDRKQEVDQRAIELRQEPPIGLVPRVTGKAFGPYFASRRVAST